jgi:FixJ family two-component response regulator
MDGRTSLEAIRLASLTPRELEIFRMLAEGRSAAECAEALALTAKYHLELPDSHQGEARRLHLCRAGTPRAKALRHFWRNELS